MTIQEFELQRGKVKLGLALAFIEGRLREGSSAERVLRAFWEPRHPLLHSLYQEHGLTFIGSLVSTAFLRTRVSAPKPA